MSSDPTELTGLLRAWQAGSQEAGDRLLPMVYVELKKAAARHLAGERQGHTLQTTALVHEAFLRLAGQRKTHWANRGHFYAVAAKLMRRILLDHARRRGAEKRGGSAMRVVFDDAADLVCERADELVALDDALRTLAAVDPFKASVVELRFFAGLTIAETAQVLGCSIDTLTRHWRAARAWLAREIARS